MRHAQRRGRPGRPIPLPMAETIGPTWCRSQTPAGSSSARRWCGQPIPDAGGGDYRRARRYCQRHRSRQAPRYRHVYRRAQSTKCQAPAAQSFGRNPCHGKNKVLASGLGGETVKAFAKLKYGEWNEFKRHLSSWEREYTLDC